MIFAAKIVSVLTGLIFQFLVAQYTLSQPGQYDIWFNIADVLAYFTLLMGVVPFWVMRFVARRKEGAAKTGLVATLIISIIGTVVYLAFIPFVLSSLGISVNYLPIYLIVSFQIAELYIISVLEACIQATIPQSVGYGIIVQQIGKVTLGFILIVYLGQPLLGAVLATIIAFAVQVAYYYRLLADHFKEPIHWGYVKEWLKGSVINIYNVIGTQLAAYVLILLYALGGLGSRGRFGAAVQITNVISYASFLAFALYPKLLADRKSEDVTTSLKIVLMFSIPMTAIAMALAPLYITILRPDFPDAAILVVVLAADTLISVVSGIYGAALFGMENVDQEKISFKKLLRSKIFVAFSLPYIQAAFTIPIAYYALTTFAYNLPYEASLSITVINTAAHFAMFIAVYALVRKMIKIEIPWRNISKYAFAAIITGIILLLAPHFTSALLAVDITEKVIAILETLVLTGVGAGIYLAILVAIDKEARLLPKNILKEIRGKNNANS